MSDFPLLVSLLFLLVRFDETKSARLLPSIGPLVDTEMSPNAKVTSLMDIHPFKRSLALGGGLAGGSAPPATAVPTCIPYYEHACGSRVRPRRPSASRAAVANPSPNNRACIPRQWRCDGVVDCENESDEIDRCEAEITARKFSSRLWAIFFIKCFFAIGISIIGRVKKNMERFT